MSNDKYALGNKAYLVNNHKILIFKRYTILYIQSTLGLGLGLPQSSSYKLLACTAYYDNSNVVEPFITKPINYTWLNNVQEKILYRTENLYKIIESVV